MSKELIFGIIGGLGLFIYGIWEMSEGLHKASGERMRKILHNLTDYALPIIGIGMLTLFLAKKKTHKYIGEFILGFGILFLGLNILTGVVNPLGQYPWFNNLFVTFSKNPSLGVLAGAVVTGIVQSSSVTTGMVLGLAMVNLLDLRAALPLILGCNIGTCFTALIASVGTSIGAKRA